MARTTWEFTARHEGLGKTRTFRSRSYSEGQRRAAEQEAKWEKLWQAQLATQAAQDAIRATQTALSVALETDQSFDWEGLKSYEEYGVPKPKINLIDKVFAGSLQRKQEAISEWETSKKEFKTAQKKKNAEVDEFEEQYTKGDPETVSRFLALALSQSQYPDFLDLTYEFEFHPENSLLGINCSLPSPESLPNLKELRYIQTRDEFRETYISKTERQRMFDGLIYQITLRTIFEVFNLDSAKNINAIVFNGFVRSIDSRTGKEINPCILTIQTNREKFSDVELSNVDAKECFKFLKGIGSSKLYTLTPIAPLLQLDKKDSRFVQSREVTNQLDDSINLALMDWEEFEHLVREVFENEFEAEGGEVKVTQSSRDKGVDAVAFDPDPVRGGKIVIQAKRYTNVVGVSAVRDLYGTVLNEGAMKGILVTTSDYGPDAYEFAQGKPLTLLNGANLLYMLERHGHRAKIDLKEAKEKLKEMEEDR